jgi:membrane-associated protease RseP (regulator of RpoE activity)
VLFQEPQPTRFDLRFRLFDVPVRVDPWFWLVCLFGSGARAKPVDVVIWIAVVFVSILVHEFGHVLAFRRYRINSHVVLWGFGGLAIPTWGGRLDPRSQIVVSFAGPLAGFLFAAILVLGLRLSGIHTLFVFGLPYIVDWAFLDPLTGGHPEILNPKLYFLFNNLLFVNIFWGLVNLLPIYPLDGGKIARGAFELSDTPDGVRKSLIVSMVAAIAMAVYGLRSQSMIYVVMFGYLAYMNYQELQSLGYGRRW